MTDRVPAKGNILGSFIPARYILAILGSVGMAIIYGLKVNLSVAMVIMVNSTELKIKSLEDKAMTNHCLENLRLPQHPTLINHTASHLNETNSQEIIAYCMDIEKNITTLNMEYRNLSEAKKNEIGPFLWNDKLQGVILSCYFWGYFVSQIPGAHVAEHFSAKYVMLASVAINVLCTILTPLAAKLHYIAMIVMRIGEGIGGGVTFPAMHVMLASWAPTAERSTMSALVYAGTSLGTVTSVLLAGILGGNFGWESIFYVMGLASSIWILLWLWLIQDSPSKQPLISQEERDYINTSLGSNDKTGHNEPKAPVPWRRIFTSLPFIAILVAHTCSNWGWYTLLIETSFYFKQVHKMEIKKISIASSVAFLTMWFFSMALSKTLDVLRARGMLSTTWARKIATLIASVIPTVCLAALCYIGDETLSMFIMGIGITSIGGMFCGFLSNHIDIAPNYAGTLMAITNTCATLPGIIMPIFVGAVTDGNQTIEAWRLVFFVTIGLYIIEIVVYTLFGSGEEQPWNKSQARELVTVPAAKSEMQPLQRRDTQPE